MKWDMSEFFELAKQVIAAKGEKRRQLLTKLAKLASGYYFQRAVLQRSFGEGRAIVWTKAATGAAFLSPQFDCKLVSTSIGCDVTRLLKYRKDKHCREMLGLGLTLGILQTSGIGIQEDVPYPLHASIAGLCRVVPILAADRVARTNQSYMARYKVISFQAGMLANFLAYQHEFDPLLETDWCQFAMTDRLPSGPRLKLLEKLTHQANRQLAGYPRFADAIGNIHINNVPEYLAEVIPYLGWWMLACEILWELLEDSEIPILGILDPFASLQDHGDDFKWN